jgi:hypothetical protein
VDAVGISGITNVDITGVTMQATAIEPKRKGKVTITIDSKDYEFDFELHNEAFNEVTLVGKRVGKAALQT